MLYEFITTYREAIIARARQKLTDRPWPAASAQELQNGVPLFLTQLAETLRAQSAGTTQSPTAIVAGATRHGAELLALGFSVSEVVHDYGDICQSVTELAIEQNAPITTDEFKTLNGCLDTAIAEAVTEHARILAESRSTEEFERSGHAAHETRDLINTAILAYQTLKGGAVAINGSTGAVLGRSLMTLQDLVDSTLADLRLASKKLRLERVLITPFLNEIAVAAGLHAGARGLRFAVKPGDPGWAVTADRQLLATAVTNLLSNAFKYTRPGGQVLLQAHTNDDGHMLIEVEDECGGILDSEGDPLRWFGAGDGDGVRRGRDRTGLGRGLSIARKAVRANGGDIHIRNIPDAGCVFVIDMPLAARDVPVSPGSSGVSTVN